MKTNHSPRAFIISFVVATIVALIIGSYAVKAATFYGDQVGSLPAFITSCLLVSWLNWVIKQQKVRWEILICAMVSGLVSILLATILGFQALVQDPAKALITVGILLMLTLLCKFFQNYAQGK